MKKIPSTILCCAAAALAACSKPADRVEITETTTRSETRDVPQVNATSDQRFALARPRDQRVPPAEPASTTAGDTDTAPQPDATMATGGESFEFETPPGWQQIAPSEFRNPNFIIGTNGEIECYVSTLKGTGGGLLVNANRWRGQMGRAPYSEEDFARLPRATVLGHEAVIVDFNGDFSGMGADQAKPGYRLVGALIQAPDEAIFIKMIGPDAATEAEKNNFALFAQSLRGTTPAPVIEQVANEPAEAEAVEAEAAPAASPGGEGAAGGFSWTAPAGWTTDPAGSSMRLVTFRFGPGGAGECYVAVLPGAAGGRLENFNRWLGQMGEPPLAETELDLQPTVFMFGEEVPMLIANGTYTGMGGESRADHVMFGSISTVGDESVFVKLVAPESIAKDNMRNFQAFCGSIKKQ